MKKNIAIIPARGGSKRIPGKNIRNFLGKPILQYSIDVAINSSLFGEVMVSTDSEEIAQIAKDAGAKVPFLRSGINSDDHAPLAQVLLEVLDEYQKQFDQQFDKLCCLLPTAPLVSVARLKEGFDLLSNVSSVVPVVAFSYPILRALELNNKNNLQMIWPENLNARSQDLKDSYHDSGSFYWIKTEALLTEETLFTKKTKALILPETEVQDIDSETDWQLAELKYQILNRV